MTYPAVASDKPDSVNEVKQRVLNLERPRQVSNGKEKSEGTKSRDVS